MTINEIFALRNQGMVEDAYEAAREVYAVDKGVYASVAMFWTAVDVLKLRIAAGRVDEARKIFKALERLVVNVKDEKGWMHDAMDHCRSLMEKGGIRTELLEKEKIQTGLLEKGAEHLQTGVWGEELAAAYLREKGYVILERDWRSKHRDIDIVAQQANSIVFVEVKTRRNREFAEPETAVDYKKLRNLRLAINHYIHYRKIENPWRFDVVTVVGTVGCMSPEINHIEDFALL